MLFTKQIFTSAAGKELSWKIDVDHFTQHQLDEIAAIVAPQLPLYHGVLGVPPRYRPAGSAAGAPAAVDNGARLCQAFRPYQLLPETVNIRPRVLLLDDVWTTGDSVNQLVHQYGFTPDSYTCFVLFARVRTLPNWVWPFWKVGMVQLSVDK